MVNGVNPRLSPAGAWPERSFSLVSGPENSGAGVDQSAGAVVTAFGHLQDLLARELTDDLSGRAVQGLVDEGSLSGPFLDDQSVSRGLLDLVVAQVAAGIELPVGAVFVGLLENDLRSALLSIDVEIGDERFPGAAAFYDGAPFRMLQFVWPDRAGLLPWEAGYDERLRLAHPVIGHW